MLSNTTLLLCFLFTDNINLTCCTFYSELSFIQFTLPHWQFSARQLFTLRVFIAGGKPLLLLSIQTQKMCYRSEKQSCMCIPQVWTQLLHVRDNRGPCCWGHTTKSGPDSHWLTLWVMINIVIMHSKLASCVCSQLMCCPELDRRTGYGHAYNVVCFKRVISIVPLSSTSIFSPTARWCAEVNDE